MNITTFTLWKNNFKKEEKHPDFIIRHKDASDKWVDIGAGWKKTMKDKVGKDGKPVTYLSCKLTEPKAKEESTLSDEERAFIIAMKKQNEVKVEEKAEEDFASWN
jgi:uncharacterized protein (DUF736 family)